MILLAEVVVLFMVDGGKPLQATLLSIDADNHNRGGSSRQEAHRWSTAVACSQAAGPLVRLLIGKRKSFVDSCMTKEEICYLKYALETLQANHHAQPEVPGVPCLLVLMIKLLHWTNLSRSLMKQAKANMMIQLNLLRLLSKKRITKMTRLR